MEKKEIFYLSIIQNHNAFRKDPPGITARAVVGRSVPGRSRRPTAELIPDTWARPQSLNPLGGKPSWEEAAPACSATGLSVFSLLQRALGQRFPHVGAGGFPEPGTAGWRVRTGLTVLFSPFPATHVPQPG